jgi:UDP-3-O-[3-hydroxymyristoyl] glucosamine N-acyltransferase
MGNASYTLEQVVERIGKPARLLGDARVAITGVSPLRSAEPGHISFLVSNKPRYLADLRTCKASAVVVDDESVTGEFSRVVVPDPAEAFDRVLALFPTPQAPPPAGVHPAAFVDPSAELADGVAVGPGCVVQAGAKIGPRTVLWPNVFVGVDCTIGADCVLHPGVVLREQTQLGDRVILHANAVIGADGFGYRTDRKTGIHHKVPQVGRVIIGNDVEVGACTTIDRAKFGATRVGDGAKIDNLCHIAHNVQIGPGCLLAAFAGVAGSTELGHHVVLAGHAGVVDNVRIGDGSVITAMSAARSDTAPGAVLSGQYACEHRQYLRQTALIRRLPELFEQVAALTRKLEATEGAAADDPKAG